MTFLIGMCRAGKTEIGKKLAQELNYNFFDTDFEIKKKYNLDIPILYEQIGDKKFRDIEFDTLKKISQDKNSIISTGGGIIENPDSIQFLKEKRYNAKNKNPKQIGPKKIQNKIIFIDTNPLIIFDRIKRAREKSNFYPKFLGNVKTNLEAKIEFDKIYLKRIPIYLNLANIHFKIENLSLEKACKQLKTIILSDTIDIK